MGNNLYGSMTYARAKNLLFGRCYGSRRLCNSTYLEREEVVANDHLQDIFHIKYHATRIMTLYPDGWTSFQVKGWETLTTKDRLRDYGDLSLYSHRGQWHVHSYSSRQPDRLWEEGMWRRPDGSLVAADRESELEKDPRPANRLRYQAGRYAAAYMSHVENLLAGLYGYRNGLGMEDCYTCLQIAAGATMIPPGEGDPAFHLRQHVDRHEIIASLFQPATGLSIWELVGDWRGAKAARRRAGRQLRDWLVARIEELEAQPPQDQGTGPWTGGTTEVRKITGIDVASRTVTFSGGEKVDVSGIIDAIGEQFKEEV